MAWARYKDEVGIVEYLGRGRAVEANLIYSDQVP